MKRLLLYLRKVPLCTQQKSYFVHNIFCNCLFVVFVKSRDVSSWNCGLIQVRGLDQFGLITFLLFFDSSFLQALHFFSDVHETH